jgi:hypothetical protein
MAGNSRLQFGPDRFHAFDATLKRLPELIAKTTVLAPSSPCTGQASAFVIQGLPEPFASAAERRPSPTSDHRPTATSLDAVHWQMTGVDIHGLNHPSPSQS